MKYNRLRQLRKDKHYTCKQMGEKLGISKAFYCQLENGSRKLYYEMAINISAIFNLKPDAIFYIDHKSFDQNSNQ